MHMQEAKKAVIDKDASNLLHGLDDNVRMRNPAGSDITGEQSRSPAAGHSQSTTTIGVYCTGVLCRCTSHLFKSKFVCFAGPYVVVMIAFVGLAVMLWIWSRNRSKSAQRVPLDSEFPGPSSPDSTSALSKPSRGPQQRR